MALVAAATRVEQELARAAAAAAAPTGEKPPAVAGGAEDNDKEAARAGWRRRSLSLASIGRSPSSLYGRRSQHGSSPRAPQLASAGAEHTPPSFALRYAPFQQQRLRGSSRALPGGGPRFGRGGGAGAAPASPRHSLPAAADVQLARFAEQLPAFRVVLRRSASIAARNDGGGDSSPAGWRRRSYAESKSQSLVIRTGQEGGGGSLSQPRTPRSPPAPAPATLQGRRAGSLPEIRLSRATSAPAPPPPRRTASLQRVGRTVSTLAAASAEAAGGRRNDDADPSPSPSPRDRERRRISGPRRSAERR